MRRLIWKEWHEQRWKLGFGCVILTAFAAIGLRSRLVPDEMLLMAVALIGATLLPVLSSMGLVAPERSDGSLHTLLALPVRAREILVAKTLMGVALCAGPMVTAMAASLLVAGGREMANQSIVDFYLMSILAILSLFMWMFAVSAHLPTEARAGLMGLAVVVCCGVVAGGVTMEVTPTWLWSACPWIFLFANQLHLSVASLGTSIGLQSVIAVGLWLWTARQLRTERGVSA